MIIYPVLCLGSYDKCVMALRDRYKDDMQPVADIIFSHNQVPKKNMLVSYYWCTVQTNRPSMIGDVTSGGQEHAG